MSDGLFGRGTAALYRAAGVAALAAMSANLLDVAAGAAAADVQAFGARTAVEWFALFQGDGLKGLYMLGLLNIVYMTCMIPVYLAMLAAHRDAGAAGAALALILSLAATAIYVSTNAAIPMHVLSARYAAAGTEAARAALAAAGEAVLARGEDFTPGSFVGLVLSGIAALAVSVVMLRGTAFGRAHAWIGVVGFGLLSGFTILSTFVPSLFVAAYYGLGMVGGLLALAWFALAALGFFRLARAEAPAGPVIRSQEKGG